MWGEAACTCSMHMHTADRSAAPDERIGLCTCPEHAAYTWTGHVYVRLCRMCVLSEACSMHMAYVHARSHAGLRASRDRRCPLAPVCAWTDTGRHGAARRVMTERCSSGFVRLSRSLAAPIQVAAEFKILGLGVPQAPKSGFAGSDERKNLTARPCGAPAQW